jgi:hypothetical protein
MIFLIFAMKFRGLPSAFAASKAAMLQATWLCNMCTFLAIEAMVICKK